MAGFLLLALALLGLSEPLVLSRWLKLVPGGAESYAAPTVAALLGLALIQGSAGARKAVLWLTGLGCAVLVLGTLAGAALQPGAAKPIGVLGALGLCTLVGILVLVTGEERSGVAITLSSIAILGGSLGALAAQVWFLKAPERELRGLITEWAGSETSYVDKAAGIELQLPPGWVALRSDNPLIPAKLAKAVFAEPSVATLAVLHYVDGERFFSVDHFLDSVLKRFQEQDPQSRQVARTTVDVGKATGRRMTFTWSTQGLQLEGVSTAWQDGPSYFALTGWTTRAQAGAALVRIRDLQSALKFDAPYATYAKATIREVTETSPMLSKSAVESMLRSIRRGAPASEFFRSGYRWAMRGIGSVDPTSSERVRAITATMFASLGAADRERLGAYLERVRSGQPTSPTEDERMSEVMRAAFQRLPGDQQGELREAFEKAIEFGRLS